MQNKNELMQVIKYLPMVFTSFKIPQNQSELEFMLDIWWKFLAPYDLAIIITAIDKHAKQCSFANIPQIADIAKDLQNKQDGNFKDAYYYFSEIEKAISYSNSKENYAKLSEFSKKIVVGPWKLAQWANDSQGFNTIISSRLLKEIENTLKQEELEIELARNKKMLEMTKQKTQKELKQ